MNRRHLLSEDGKLTVEAKSYVGQLVHKFGPLLEGVPNRTDYDRYHLGAWAVLMENQAQFLRALDEETRTLNVGAFTKYIFPVLRRVFPNLITPELISVQPMTAPIGAVFYLDYVYGTNKAPTTQGEIFPKDFNPDYSSEYVNGEILGTGDGAKYGAGGTVLTATLGFNPVRPLDATRGYSLVVRELHVTTGAVVQEAIDDGTGGFTGAVQAGSTINYSNGAITNFKFTLAVGALNPVKAYYYYDGELSNLVPQVGLDIKKATVEAIPHRLKALWSPEAAEDMRALHGVDAETEMVAAVAQEIGLEIDRRIISALFQSSTGTTATFDRVPPAAINELDHLRALITQISTVSNLIHKKTLRAPANWIVTSCEVSALLTQLTTHGDFRPLWVSQGESPYGPVDQPRPMTQHGQFSIYKTGTLMNKWMVYEDPFFTRDQMMIGLKGATYLDSGAVWAPYVPLQVTPSFLDPDSGTYKKGFRTRYAFKILRSEFYGSLRVLNL